MAGLGVAFISGHTVATELSDGQLVALDVVGLPVVRRWYVVYRRDRALLPPAMALANFLSHESRRFLPRVAKRPNIPKVRDAHRGSGASANSIIASQTPARMNERE